MNASEIMKRYESVRRYYLPGLLGDPAYWKTKDITYEQPRVERVYRALDDIENYAGWRLFLHRIHPCEVGQSFLHPHPWPSVVEILSGSYEMRQGYSDSLDEPSQDSLQCTVFFNRGIYTMTDPNLWHEVNPRWGVSYSVMLIGPPWDRPMPKVPREAQPELPEADKLNIMAVIGTRIPANQ